MAERRRLYSIQPLTQSGATTTLDADESHHGLQVLRLRRGEEALVFDAEGRQFAAVVEATDRMRLTLRLGDAVAAAPETPVPISLYLALAKSAAFDNALMRAVELGAAEIVPFAAERSVSRVVRGREAESKTERWRQILLSATKQCGRARLTSISTPLSFEEAVARPSVSALRFCCAMATDAPKLSAVLHTLDLHSTSALAVMIGPEGGLTDSEIHAARHHGWQPVSLGPRILRVETAATAALASILAWMSDL